MLGCGAFGRVYRATVADLSSGETNVTVAVKMIRARSDKTQLLALQSELKILMHIGKHVNIVNLVATCTKNIHKKGKIFFKDFQYHDAFLYSLCLLFGDIYRFRNSYGD
ncbi:Platelet-derived growth factor receptor beta [Portunus trituberculatus]|uniref:Platelet-derived growth factor receptor beta n=1 Tax=Portunus trituberculatus TaxID=210409 RepID=A0A5B7H1E5_PORTR|nr:Platelet-derived growth factor receptor beta [Portunus trituberculatus]